MMMMMNNWQFYKFLKITVAVYLGSIILYRSTLRAGCCLKRLKTSVFVSYGPLLLRLMGVLVHIESRLYDMKFPIYLFL